MDNDLCGLVAATMTEVDTSRFYDQVQGDLFDFRANEQAKLTAFFNQKQREFDLWFDDLQSSLDGDVAANRTSPLQKKAAAYNERVTISPDAWSASGDGYAQQVACTIASGSAADIYIISPTHGSEDDYAICGIYAAEVGAGYIVFHAERVDHIGSLTVNVCEIEKGPSA